MVPRGASQWGELRQAVKRWNRNVLPSGERMRRLEATLSTGAEEAA